MINVENKSKHINFFLIINFMMQMYRYIFIDNVYTYNLLLFLQTILILYVLKNINIGKRCKSIELTILFFLFYSIISYMIRLSAGQNLVNISLSFVTDITSMIVIIFYYVIIISPFNDEDLGRLLMTYLLFSIIFLLFAFIFQFQEIILSLTSSSAYASNFSSFFQNRNGFAYYLFLFLLVYITQYEFYKARLKTTKYYIVFFITIAGLFLTLSRTATSSLLIFIFLYAINKFIEILIKDKYKLSKVAILYSLLLIVFVFVLIIMTKPDVMLFIQNKLIRSGYGNSGRSNIWKSGISIWKNNKLFGIGSFQSRGVIEFSAFHNTYIEVLIRNGLIGLGLRILIIYQFINYYFKNILNKNYEKRNIIAMLVSILVSMMFESILFFGIGFREVLFLYVIFVLTRPLTIKSKDKMKS